MTDAAATPRHADFPSGPVRPLAGWRAFCALTRDRDNTRHVFDFLRAVNGKSSGPYFRKFLASDFGRTVLADPQYLDRKLLDRESLEAAGPDTMAAVYLHYLDSENLQPLGVVEASKEAAPELHARIERDYPEFAIMRRSGQLTHDLFHVLTGYGRDPLGEALLLEFSGAQSGSRGTRMLGAMAGLRIRAEIPRWPVGRMMRNATRMARRGTDLGLTDLTAYLPMKLDDARAALNIAPDPVYREIRDTWTGPEPVTQRA